MILPRSTNSISKRRLCATACAKSKGQRVSLVFSAQPFDLVKQVGGINDSQKTKALAKLLRLEICCGHQIQQIFVAADQLFCARSDREIDIRFIVRVAGVFKDSRDFVNNYRLLVQATKQ